MSSTLTHIFIPIFILLIFSEQLKLSKRMIFALCIFAILPDLDMFIFHRAALHNIFVLLIPIFIYVFWNNIKLVCIMEFYILSHILLDLFNQGVYLFYPFYSKVIYFMVGVSYEDSIITPIYKLIIEDEISTEFFKMPMISSENTATILLIIIMLVIVMTNKHKTLNRRNFNLK